jgi:hypothetical protein
MDWKLFLIFSYYLNNLKDKYIFDLFIIFYKKILKKWNYILVFNNFYIKINILYFIVTFYLAFENWKYILK